MRWDLVDIFPFQRGEKGVQSFFVGFDAYGSEKRSDVVLSRMRVGKLKEQICCEMFHCELSSLE